MTYMLGVPALLVKTALPLVETIPSSRFTLGFIPTIMMESQWKINEVTIGESTTTIDHRPGQFVRVTTIISKLKPTITLDYPKIFEVEQKAISLFEFEQ